MGRMGSVALLVALVLGIACGNNDKQTTANSSSEPGIAEQKQTEKPLGQRRASASPEKRAEPAESPVDAQCNRILDKCFVAIQPAMKLLGISEPSTIEAEYKKSAKNFLARCAKLDEQKRDCLEKAENPVSAIDSCEVNSGKKAAEKLLAPSLERFVKLFDSAPLPSGQNSKILAGLRGTWVCNWKEAKTHLIWTIKKNGEVAERRRAPNGKISQKHFKISFVSENRMKVHWSEQSVQYFTFLRAGRRVFFAGGNLAYDFFPIKSNKSFVVRDSGDYIFFDAGECKVANVRGLLIDGKCSFTRKRGQKVFKVNWHYPGQVFLDGKPREQERTYFLVGKNLVDERLFRSSRFRKM
jgi:hypothetical protein